ncbi:hypothetical protein [Shewanella violacea]|uniref:Lipoprotein n=1 Tax=Shewanella violacea (strain JCM 10179 / CIP 106290 / LMG 19151 / DSS12) TaxID=637905 RepID=D4ZJU5_SHEVD|nr:hypothetical protein [Shewanella violacea]BAJ01944.1 hypothetical protein SVI_1973 [Shewanella violacea DSS12]
MKKLAAPILILSMVTALSACNSDKNPSPSPKPPVPPAPTVYVDGIYVDTNLQGTITEEAQLLIGGYMFEFTEKVNDQIIRNKISMGNKLTENEPFESDIEITKNGQTKIEKVEYTVSNDNKQLTIKSSIISTQFNKMKSVWPDHEMTFVMETPDGPMEVVVDGNKLTDPQVNITLELTKLANNEFRIHKQEGLDFIIGVWYDENVKANKLVMSNYKDKEKADIYQVFTEK